MIIKGFPYILVSTYDRVRGERVKRNLFRFDQHGEYRTNDPKILKKAQGNFEIIEEPNETDTTQVVNDTDDLMPFEEIDETVTESNELKPKRTRGVPRKKKEIK